MAKKKFTQLPSAGAFTGTEIFAIVQDGESRQATSEQMAVLASAVVTPIWEWAAHSNNAPIATKAGQTWITKGEYIDGEFLIEDGSLLIAKDVGASTVDPLETEFWIKP